MDRSQLRNLALYLPVVLISYLLACATVETLRRTTPLPFWTMLAECGAYGWLAPLVFAPAALVLLFVAARMPDRWSSALRRVLLLLAAPPLFAGAMAAFVAAVSGSTAILTWPYVSLVVVPALAYAAVIQIAAQDAVATG